jgi:2-keto-4-pentenoate hydratase/2-oxohepta-3-ene-1,7-dioic acid hydratase in catechol pathway
MKIIRYSDSEGLVRHAAQQEDGSALDISGDILGDYQVTDVAAQVDKLLAPLIPAAILGIGLNYRHHAEESGAKIPEYPILFVKGPNTLQNPNDPIEIPTTLPSEQVDYECELAVVIGKSCKNVRREDALEYVLGYTCANDVSARDWQISAAAASGAAANSSTPLLPWGRIW